MIIEIKPIMLAEFIKEFKNELSEVEIEYIGNVLLGEEDEFTDNLLLSIEEGNLEHVKLIIEKIFGD